MSVRDLPTLPHPPRLRCPVEIAHLKYGLTVLPHKCVCVYTFVDLCFCVHSQCQVLQTCFKPEISVCFMLSVLDVYVDTTV